MSRRITLATFGHEHDALTAAAELRRHGFQLIDVYSPHAIHRMDEVLGLKPSRLTWVCFVCGAVGAIGMLWFQHWASAVSWPINVGGKPWNSLPAEVPVAFEMLVLLAAFGSVLAFFAVSRLFPGKRPDASARGATDDKYVIAIDESPGASDAVTLDQLLCAHGVAEVRERIVEEERWT